MFLFAIYVSSVLNSISQERKRCQLFFSLFTGISGCICTFAWILCFSVVASFSVLFLLS